MYWTLDSRRSISNKYLCKFSLKEPIEDEKRIFSGIEFQKEIIKTSEEFK